jgi:CelD/BcsL family acetyltransferase involved in cellulose biosynthesis
MGNPLSPQLAPNPGRKTESLPVHRIEPLTDPRWDALVARHPRASVFHTRAWLEALRRTYGYAPIAYTTSPPDASLQNAIAFCRVESWLTGRRLVSLPFSDHCEPLVSDAADLNAVVSALEQKIAEEDVRYIELRPQHALDSIATPFRPHHTYCFHQLNLRPDPDVLFKDLHKDSVQRKIRRAEREGLTCDTGDSAALIDAFWRLFVLTRRRHLVPPPPKRWFRNVLACLGPAAALRVAFHGKQPVAAVITLRCNDTMVYKYGCSDVRFQQLGGMQFLLWTSIQVAKRDGLSLFDFGRSDWDNRGLITFKDRWGASRSVLTYARLPASIRSTPVSAPEPAHWTGRFTKQVLSWLPDRISSAVGSLLYKHMG